MKKKKVISVIALVVFLLSSVSSVTFAEEIDKITSIVNSSEQLQQLSAGTGVSITLIGDDTPVSEGIYYFVNKANGNYLYKKSEGCFVLSPTCDIGKQWVCRTHEDDVNGHFFELMCDSYDGYLDRNEQDDPRQNKICFHFYENNAYTIRLDYAKYNDSDLYSLINSNDYISDNEITCWWKLSEDCHHSEDECQWYIYKVNYAMGDVNKDGNVNATDANLINRYAAKLEIFTETQKYLGDLNNDGVINATDALAVLKIASKIE